MIDSPIRKTRHSKKDTDPVYYTRGRSQTFKDLEESQYGWNLLERIESGGSYGRSRLHSVSQTTLRISDFVTKALGSTTSF